jgi:hypothetical protein
MSLNVWRKLAKAAGVTRTATIPVRHVFLGFVVVAVVVYLVVRPPPLELSGRRPELKIETLIREVKRQLEKADEAEQRAHRAALFKLETFDLEVAFTVKSDASAGVKLYAVQADTHVEAERVDRISLHWKALPPPEVSATYDPSLFGQPPAVATPSDAAGGSP